MIPVDWDSLYKGPLNILPYGEPGCGKTRFALSAGEVLHTLFIDVDNGLRTAKTVPQTWLKNIVPMRMTDFTDIDRIYKLLMRNDPAELSKALSTPLMNVVVEKPFEAVVFDTWSEVNWEIKEQKRADIKKQGDGSLKFRPNIEIQDWGNIIDLNQLCIEAFRDLPITFICCMHEMYFEDKKGGRTSGTPSINGKFAAEIGKHFDIVGHMSVNVGGEYVMDTAMKARFQAKSRVPLEKQIKNVTYKGILEAMK
jgi:hypothetical protein